MIDLPAPTYIQTSDVAAMLGLANATAFLSRKTQLEEDHDFPLPMPQQKRPLLYRRDQVLAWLDQQGRPRAEPVHIPEGTNVQRLFEKAATA